MKEEHPYLDVYLEKYPYLEKHPEFVDAILLELI